MNAKAEFITTAPRIEQERAGKIRTFTGKYVDPFDMKAEDLDIRDIAHHLSLINRYTGATQYAYSVAQHSIAVSRHFIDPTLRLAGLLHDAAEYVLNDIASPVKRHPSMIAYVQAQERLDALVFVTFGLDPALLKQVKAMDDLEFTRECASFWGTIDYQRKVRPMSAGAAEHEFLAEFHKIAALSTRSDH